MHEMSDIRYKQLEEEKNENIRMENTERIDSNKTTKHSNMDAVLADINVITVNPNTQNIDNFVNYRKESKSMSNHKFCLILMCTSFAFVLFLMITLRLKNVYFIDKEKTSICTSDNCMLLSANIYNSMNRDIDPCDDFYEYSCGNWIDKNLIPNGYSRWNIFSQAAYANSLILRRILESNSSNYTNAELKAISYYQSCIDPNGSIEQVGSKPLYEIINKFVYKTESNELIINETWTNLLYFTQMQFGLDSLFEIAVSDDYKNSTINDFQIEQGYIDLDRSYYLNLTIEKNRKVLDVLNQTIVNIITKIHGEVNNLTEIVNNHIKFSTRLAEIMLPLEETYKIQNIYSRVSLKDLTSTVAPFLDWTQFINSLLTYYDATERVTKEDTIVVLSQDFFRNLTELIKNEKEETLKFYIYYNLVKHILPLLSNEYYSLLLPLRQAISGATRPERWHQCFNYVDNIQTFGYATSRMFLRKIFDGAKPNAVDMINRIREALIGSFPSISWMDQSTRAAAVEKLRSMSDMIGFPEFILNDDLLNQKYENLAMNATDYFNNEIRLTRNTLKNTLNKYRKLVNRSEWEMTTGEVNAYYTPSRNLIAFPAGILRDPFFSKHFLQAVNFGSIGSVVGHEMSHGFDNLGSQFDKNGNVKQWWSNRTLDAYNNATICMIDQYSVYSINGENLNGKQTLGENIADNGGMKASYIAYLKWIDENGEEDTLPLLNVTNRQLFFIAYAQTWCSKSTDGAAHLQLATDVHSLPKYRVIGSLSNSEEFSKTFKCKPGSNMNPTKKCSVL